jgi:flagellar hook-basal body complex protein FliE
MNTGRIGNQIYSDRQQVDKKVIRQDFGFADKIKNAIRRVNDINVKADSSVEKLMHGKTGIHEAMLDLQRADISLRILLQVRNKALEAYKEIMHMQF